jgi:putative transposase
MARKLRVEFEGALYHVISRGNYRAPIFAEAGTKHAFVSRLYEACKRSSWKLHAYVVMSNHYHLALETPLANLCEGMHWLQTTFSTSFNRFRAESGHVFQGRYKAINVESYSGLGCVAHYIHLNPVRAKLCTVNNLGSYSFGSYPLLANRRKRPEFVCFDAALQAAGELSDGAAGAKSYHNYLSWLAESEAEQKRLKFHQLSRGWVIGSKEFKKTLAEDLKEQLRTRVGSGRELTEARESLWEALLERMLERLQMSRLELLPERKASPRKVAIAVQLKKFTGAKNPWITAQLGMGDPDGVSRYVGQFRRGELPDVKRYLQKITDIRT